MFLFYRSSSISAQPYLSAFEGVFLSHSAAKEYMSWFADVVSETVAAPETNKCMSMQHLI